MWALGVFLESQEWSTKIHTQTGPGGTECSGFPLKLVLKFKTLLFADDQYKTLEPTQKLQILLI